MPPSDRDERAVARDQAARTMRALERELVPVVEQALTRVARGFVPEIRASVLAGTPRGLVAQAEVIDPAVFATLAALWERELDGILEDLQQVYERSWVATSRRFAGSPTRTVPALVDEYLRTARNRLVLVGDDLWDAARRELAAGMAEGESVAQLRRRLQDTFAAGGVQLGETRATRIARTEVVSAWNSASRDSIHALPDGQRPRFQTWLATLDEDTRPEHWAADGQQVPIDAPFIVGGEQLAFPGDPNGSPDNTIQCRCVVTYSFDDTPIDDEGRQFLSDEEIRELDRQRPGRGEDAELVAANLTTDSAAESHGPGARNREPGPMTQTDVVIATVQAGGHWTPDDVASKTGIAKPTVRTILSRAVETGKLRRLERGVYAAATTEVPWHTPAPFALMFEGVETGDGRLIDPAATLWDPDEEQWPHQWAARNEGGHLGAELAGAIRRFRRGGISEHGIRMPASGVLYTDTEAGADYEAHLRRGAPAGVSVDLDDISFEIVDKAGGEPVELLVASASVLHVPGEGWRITTPEAAEIVAAAGGETAGLVASAGDPDDGIGEVVYSEQAGDVVMRITSARFRGATGVALPAFDKARIVLGEDPEQAAVVDDTPEPAEVTAAVVGDVDLPIHEDRDEPWDGPAAGSRVLEWAQRGDADDEEIAARLSRAFLWRNDSANPATLSAYRLGVADVFGDELHIVPRGVFATAGSRGVDALVGVSEEDRERLRTRVCGLYERINEAFPDDEQLECRWRRDDDMGQQVEAAAFGDSAMLALIPADPDALTVEGGDAAGEMHVTLAFLGDAAGLSEEAVQVARDAAAAAAEAHGPLEARVAGIGTLGSEDPPATVLLLNGADMDQAREAVWAQLADFGWEAFAEQHQPWLPHLTVGYGVAPDTVTAPEVIRLDRVRLAMGDQVTDFPLAVHRDEDRDRDDEMAELEASAWQEFQQLPPMPAPWFGEPTEAELPPDSGGVRYDGGRIFGWVVQDGVPHQGYPGKNLTLDKLLPLDTSEFLRQTFQLDDGTTAKAGPFTMNVGHHRDGYECETSACQFDDSRTVAGIITVGLNDRGLWFSGAAAPWLSEWDRLVFASCQPSYHLTQNRGGGYKLGAVLSVPVPGHPSRLAAAGVDHETAVRSVRAVVERSNLALTASTQTTGPTEPAGPVWEVKAKVVPVIDWDQANTDPGGSRLMELLASAVVDEMERRGRAEAEARAEIEALRAELGLEAVEEKTEEQTVKVGG